MNIHIQRDGQQMGQYPLEQVNELFVQATLMPTSPDWHEAAPCDKRSDMFGKIFALTGTECASTVRVNETSGFFTIENMEELMVQNPTASLFITKILAHR